MKTLLMYRDRPFDSRQALPWNAGEMTQDLELETLLHAMARGDAYLLDIARGALLAGTQRNDLDTIRYRQDILTDSLKNSGVTRRLYDLTVETVDLTKKGWWRISSRSPGSMLYNALDLLETILCALRKLKTIAVEDSGGFRSEGFTTLFATLRRELNDEFLDGVRAHLIELKFRKGVLLSAELGRENEGTNYRLCRAPRRGTNWIERILRRESESHTFHLAERDQAGAQILTGIQHRGISRAATTLTESSDHIVSFVKLLRTELAFYVGCLNLHDRLVSKGEPVCLPTATPADERRLHFRGLYDVSLSLRLDRRVVGNNADADGKRLTIITGANQGGKSTFLRSLGVAQLMMQCGIFVAAETFTASLCPALYTHFKREEDVTMKSGKFDEELARLSSIVDHVAPHSFVLFNESFAATNDREGGEIATQIVRALTDKHIKIAFVTHLYEFARAFLGGSTEDVLFLRAERIADGTRTFRLIEGEPQETSYGEDLYRQVFGAAAVKTAPGA